MSFKDIIAVCVLCESPNIEQRYNIHGISFYKCKDCGRSSFTIKFIKKRKRSGGCYDCTELLGTITRPSDGVTLPFCYQVRLEEAPAAKIGCENIKPKT